MEKIRSHSLAVELGADPNLIERGENRPRIYAACSNDVRAATLLLDQGATIEEPNCRLETPLGFACAYDADDVVRLLCERGAEVNGTEDWGHSYLWAVQCEKQTEVEAILLSCGAKVVHVERVLPPWQ